MLTVYGMFFAIALAFFGGYINGETSIWDSGVKSGHAMYDATTGNLRWKTDTEMALQILQTMSPKDVPKPQPKVYTESLEPNIQEVVLPEAPVVAKNQKRKK